jgi:protein-S-isoprenylcysteine O-methyltransferase Ste14
MKICESLQRDGAFLFRWRSYVPLVLLPLLFLALKDAADVERAVGQSGHDLWGLACYAIAISGLAIRWIVVATAAPGTSGRNVKAQRADSLNTTGIYSVVRHPLYLGNFVAIMGIAMSLMVWWFALVAALAYWLYIERIMAAEEKFLAAEFGADFDAWASATPAFLPRFSLWRPSHRRAAIRTVFKREYNGVLAVALSFLAIEFLLDVVVTHQDVVAWAREDIAWPIVFAASLVIFLSLRWLKKNTGILDIA